MEETGNHHPATLSPATPARTSRAWRIVAIVLTLHAVLLGSFVLIQGCSKTENGPISETQPASEAQDSAVVSNFPTKSDQTQNDTILPGNDVLTPEEHIAEASSPAPAITDEKKVQEITIPVAPVENKIAEAPVPAKTPISVVKYKVKKGDSLTQIAKRNKINVNALASANKLTVKSVLKVGQTLNIPQTTKAATMVSSKPSKAIAEGRMHLVKSGENLTSIARKYGITLQSLLSANHISDPKKIRVNQKLIIPTPKVASSAAPVAIQPKEDLYPVAAEEPVTAGQEIHKI